MALSDIVHVTYVSTNPGVTQAGFGVPMILSPNATGSDRIKFYADIDAVADDWDTNTPEYLAAEVMFSQTTGLSRLAIGRAVNKPTQRYTISVASVAVGGVYEVDLSGPSSTAWVEQTATYTAEAATTWAAATAYSVGDLVTNDSGKLYVALIAGTSAGSGGPTGTSSSIVDNGVTWTYAGTGSAGVASNDAILYALKNAIDAFADPVLDLTTSLQGSAGSLTLQLLANTAGDFFGLALSDTSLLWVKQDHSDPGVAADLAAISDASKEWYGLVTLHNSQALVLAAAAWVEAAKKLYTPDTIDSRVEGEALNISTDVGQALKALAYARTGPCYHRRSDEFMGGAEMARWFPINPGGDNWTNKTLAGVTAQEFSGTQETNIKAKLCNYYTTLAGVNVVQGGGHVSANEYIDVVRFRDWYEARLQEGCANVLIQEEKVPYTDAGINKIENVIDSTNKAGIAAGGIADDPAPTIIVPKAASASSADRAARQLTGVKSTWRLAGAINEIFITVSGQP